MDAVEALTHREGESYDDFIVRAAANDLARGVKLEDLFDNCDLSRLPHKTPDDFARLQKYKRAILTIRALHPSPRVVRQPPSGPAIREPLVFLCRLCGTTASEQSLLLAGPGRALLWSWTFMSAVERHLAIPSAAFDTIVSALATQDANALYRFNFEMAPFYCPDCDATYCGAHWIRWGEFDPEAPMFHDCIRGRCPEGHERMLED